MKQNGKSTAKKYISDSDEPLDEAQKRPRKQEPKSIHASTSTEDTNNLILAKLINQLNKSSTHNCAMPK